MPTLLARPRLLLCFAALFLAFAAPAIADDYAYAALANKDFGILNLSTGAYTSLGSTAVQITGMAELNGVLYGAYYEGDTLYSINPANGTLTAAGTTGGGVLFDTFGATPDGMYAIEYQGVGQNNESKFYSISTSSGTFGAASLVGTTGINGLYYTVYLSNGSSTLYYEADSDLYTIDSATGTATKLGSMGGPSGIVQMENGTLYLASDSDLRMYTLSTSDASSTLGAAIRGLPYANDYIYALAPYPVPEGGASLLYLLLAASTCGAAHFLSSRTGAKTIESA